MPGLLSTQLVGSYSKPDWLIRHRRVTSPSSSFWRPGPEVLAEAQDDATIAAISDQERAGLDLITDGEQRRQRFDTYFFGMGGIDGEKLGPWSMSERDMSFVDLDPEVEARLQTAVTPRAVGEITWPGPITVNDLGFLKHHTRRPTKMTVIGPLTMAARLADEHYRDPEALGMAAAAAINRELRALDEAGVDVVQLDEPDFHFRRDMAVQWGGRALDLAFDGVRAARVVHVCYGYATIGDKRADPNYAEVLEAIAASSTERISIEYEQPGHGPELLAHCGDKGVILGLLDLGTEEVESPSHIADRIRAALQVLGPERLHLAPDCGMWFVPRPVAFAKISSLVQAARTVRRELGLSAAASSE